MKKIKKFLKSNIKVILAFIIGGTIVVGTKAATLFSSTLVLYNNTKSVDTALDELYTKVNLSYVDPNNMGTPTNYIFNGTNKPTTSSPTTPPSGKNVYLGLYVDGQYGVCIKRNGIQHCFRYNNWIAEKKHVQEVFSDVSCNVYSNRVGCDDSNIGCSVSSAGNIYCTDFVSNKSCGAYGNGNVECG